MVIDEEIKAENGGASGETEELFKAGAHFGYSRSRRHPAMAPFIYGIKNNTEIFDLEKVWGQLKAAASFLEKLGKAKKSVLWVGTKPSVAKLVVSAARR